MIRIAQPFIFSTALELEPLSKLPDGGGKFHEVFLPLAVAENAIQALTGGSLFAPYLRSSWQLSQQLLTAIRKLTQTTADWNRDLGPFDLWEIKNLYSQYRTALLAELGTLNTYFVTAKGPFDMAVMLQFGEMLFPFDLVTKVPEAVFDAREAAKCLAFEVPSACGFHVFRATESVLRKYWAHVTGGKAAPKVRTLGVYARALQQAKQGDPKIVASIIQMTTLHRNPLIHPEVVLTSDEAIAIVGIARSAITGMLAVLPIVPATTTGGPTGPVGPPPVIPSGAP